MKTLLLLFFVVSSAFGARSFNAASNQYLYLGSGTVFSYPVSMSAWFKTNDLSANRCIVANNSDISGVGTYMILRGNDAGDPLSASDFDGSTAARANSGGSVTTGVWTHGGAVFQGTSSRSVYLNGTRTDNSTAVSGFSTPERTRIGTFLPSNSPWSGEIAEVAIWNVTLTDDEMLILAAGFSPLVVRPSALQLYVPLWSGAFDYITARAFTDSGGTTDANDHPRIYR